MPRKLLDDRKAELVRAYVEGRPIPPSDPPTDATNELPPPSAARRVSMTSDPAAKVLEGTHKRIGWIVGILCTLGAAVGIGWGAREVVYQASHYYAPYAVVGSAEAIRAELDQTTKTAKTAIDRLDNLEKRLTDIGQDQGELNSRFDHATKPGQKRPMLFPRLSPDAGAPASGRSP